MTVETAPERCSRCTPSLYYGADRPCAYLAGHTNRPAIAVAALSKVTGVVAVRALFAHAVDGTPQRGDYIGGGCEPDTIRAATSGYWTRRTTKDAERLLVRADYAPGYQAGGWRVVTVGDAAQLLVLHGYTLATAATADAYSALHPDDDPDATWLVPREPTEREYSRHAFVVPV